MKRFLAPFLLILLAAAALVWWAARALNPSVETIASASLKEMRAQNKLSAFAANYVAVVTSNVHQYGLSARKTLILPGMVQYSVDLSKLNDGDVRWNAGAKTLNVHLPPVVAEAPQIDLQGVQEYGEGGILRTLTDADAVLDAANRAKGVAELTRQAQGPVPMKLAREATKAAVEHNFAAPLRAAGIDAKIVASFEG